MNPDLYSVECKHCGNEFLTLGYPDDISGCIDETECPKCKKDNYLAETDTKKKFLGEVVKTENIVSEMQSAEKARQSDPSQWREGYISGLNKALILIREQ